MTQVPSSSPHFLFNHTRGRFEAWIKVYKPHKDVPRGKGLYTLKRKSNRCSGKDNVDGEKLRVHNSEGSRVTKTRNMSQTKGFHEGKQSRIETRRTCLGVPVSPRSQEEVRDTGNEVPRPVYRTSGKVYRT